MIYVVNGVVILLAILWKQEKLWTEDSAVRKEWLRAMCMGKAEADQVVAGYRKRKQRIFYLILIGCMLSLVAAVWEGFHKEPITVLQRPEYGDGNAIYRLQVEGLQDTLCDVELEVAEQKLSAAEQEAWLEEQWTELLHVIPGGNQSLETVTGDLHFPAEYESIQLLWYSQVPEIVSDWGEIMTDELPESGSSVWIRAELHYQDTRLWKEFCVVVYPPPVTAEAERRQALTEMFAAREADEPGEAVTLPSVYAGRNLTYYEKKEPLALQLLMMSVIGALVLIWNIHRRPGKELRERSRQLELDYAEVVTKLMIYMRAGFSIRGAWEQMIQEYQVSREEGKHIRYVYEEMQLAYYRMESGISEGMAYAEFGRQCNSHAYLRLGNLLEQYVRKGGGELLQLLEQEMQDAFEEQKNAARKMGEEAQTKMLLPMGMMLGVILVILIVPVFLGFSI